MNRIKALLTVAVLLAVPASGAAAPAGGGGSGRARIAPEVVAAARSGRPVRYVVRLREKADLTAARALPTQDARRVAVVKARRDVADRTQADLRRILAAARASGAVSSYHPFWITNAIGVQSTGGVMRAIASRPEVAEIAADRVRHIVAETAADGATPGWNIDKVGAPQAWDLGILGTGTVVASIDTGVDAEHPSVSTKYRGAGGSEDYGWWDAINHDVSAYDDNGHGTHTMGTMAGGDADGPDPDDIGVAPGATWIAAKAFDLYGGGYDTWIFEAAEFLAAPTKADGTDPQPELAPDVINNSWGGGQCDPWFDDTLETWRAMDIFPAFAIGNSGPSSRSTGSPGDRPGAFGVGATTIDDEIAYFSSRGPDCDDGIKPEISAPGQDVRSSLPDGEFGELSGTSMATPHVAGTVALLTEAAAGTLTVDELETTMQETALDLGEAGADNTFGAGRLQVFEAVQEVLRGGLIEGHVVDAGGDPVDGAKVTFTGGEKTVRVRSKSDGSYRARLLAGTWLGTATAFGYLPSSASAVIVEGETVAQDFALALAPVYTMTGTVEESPSGTPLAGATVRVLDTPLEPVTTDGTGAFSVDVPAGVYDVRASKGGCRLEAVDEVDLLGGPLSHTFSLQRKVDAYGHVCDEVSSGFEPGTHKIDLSGYAEKEKVDLPFTFSFYGSPVDAVWATTTGYVATVNGTPKVSNVMIPAEDTPNGAIYALWDELWVRGSARGVYTATLGDAPDRRFVIEYRNFEVLDTGDLTTFEIVLFEDGGAIEVRYKTVEGRASGVGATIGIEDPTGTMALGYAFEKPMLTDGLSVRYVQGPFGVVAGTVTSAADGLPVAAATVTDGEQTSRSASNGTYRLAGEPGTRTVSVSAPGFESMQAEVTFVDGVSVLLDVALDAPLLLAPAELPLSSSGVPISVPVEVTNGGTRPLAIDILERDGNLPLDGLIDDPAGDADEVDATGIDGSVADGVASYAIGFTEDSNLTYLGGYLHLDVDQDSSTGRAAEELDGAPEQDVGCEYFIDLFDVPWYSTVNVWTSTGDYVGTVDASIDDAVVSFDVPLEMLGDDDGNMNLSAVVEDWYSPTDWVPDAGHATLGVPDDVFWLGVDPPSATLEPGESTTLDVTVSPAGLASGEHLAQVLYDSNDPRASRKATLVRLTTTDDAAPATTIDARPGGLVVPALAAGRLSGVATDEGSGVETVVVSYTGLLGDVTEWEADLSCDDEGGTTCTWTAFGPTVPGPYEVTARATDRDGNVQDPPASASVIVI